MCTSRISGLASKLLKTHPVVSTPIQFGNDQLECACHGGSRTPFEQPEAVMEHKDLWPIAYLSQHASSDSARVRCPGVEDEDMDSNGTQVELMAYLLKPFGHEPDRRPKIPWTATRDLLDDPIRPLKVSSDVRHRVEGQQIVVSIRVVTDEMAFTNDALGEFRIALDIFADQEKSRLNLMLP
jgi:hypothetical protein